MESSKVKAFVEDKTYVVQMRTSLFNLRENIEGKGEIAGYLHFLPFPTMFSKDFTLVKNSGLCGKRVNYLFSGRYITIKKQNDLDDNCLMEISKRHPISLALIQCQGEQVTAKGLRDLFRQCAPTLKVKFSC